VIPLRDENPTRLAPVLTVALIAVNIAVFVLWQPTLRGSDPAAQVEQQIFYWCHGAVAFEIVNQTSLAAGGDRAREALEGDYGVGAAGDIQNVLRQECPRKSWLLSVLVAMFLHGGWLHLGGNMLFLWVFGNNIEDRLGHVLFLPFYMAGGATATLLQVAVDTGSSVPNVGASGAIAAVLGAYIVLHPHARVMSLLFIFFFIRFIELPAFVVLGLWFLLQLYTGVGGLGSDVAGGVAYFAHIGGFVFGSVVALAFLRGRRSERPHAGPYAPPQRPDWT
jgi:membrane associated rhomboid family serine protease